MNRFMKKAAVAVMSLAMVASAGAAVSADVLKTVPALSASANQSGYLTYTVNADGTATITGIVDDDLYWIQNVVVPEVIDGHPVSAIESGAFENVPYLKTVTINAKIKELEAFTFLGCVNLEKVVLPASLKKILPYAFQDCVKLKSIIIPYRVQYIGSEAFKNCKNLKEIIFRCTKCNYIASNAFDKNGRSAKVYLVNVNTSNDLYKYFKGTDGQGHYNYYVYKYMLGDVNGDNQITHADAVKALEAFGEINVGLPSGLTRKQEIAVDADENYTITALDAQYIEDYVQYVANGNPAIGMEAYMCLILNGNTNAL